MPQGGRPTRHATRTTYSLLLWNISEELQSFIKREHRWPLSRHNIFQPTPSTPSITSNHLTQMSFVQFYYNPFTEFDRLFEDASAARSCPWAFTPSRHGDIYRPRYLACLSPHFIHVLKFLSRLNLRESKDTNTVTATFELPGLTSDGVAIDVHQNRLTVSGESPAPDSEEEKSYVIHEHRSGKFSRTLQLPFGTKVSSSSGFLDGGS